MLPMMMSEARTMPGVTLPKEENVMVESGMIVAKVSFCGSVMGTVTNSVSMEPP
jgi:hypothetical protein